ncbi:MAG TPA: HEAT repeat domain-containing protein [Pyrinomonadaceae bacterium]|nr:HEAT repeat domain-containing protein [Pyrinomonadaceae bacterium]
MNQKPRSLANSSSVLRFAFVLVLTATIMPAQSRIGKPAQPNTNANSGKRQHIATVRSSDSTEGSRVAITSDRPLNDYEAYRRGDRFYVKIPAADVTRAEAVRGRGFVDVKAQKSGDSTILSFRLQPGATAHVEQRANKLDVVVSVPGGGTPTVASNRTRETIPNVTSGMRGANPSRGVVPSTNPNKPAAKNSSNSNTAPKQSATPTNSNKAPLNSGSANKSSSSVKPTPTPIATPTAKPSPSANPSATVKPSATPLKSLTAGASSPTATPANIGAQTQGDWWSRLKERAHYWILLAQLNPIPVGLGAGLLLLITGLVLFQRRRARGPRRARPAKSKRNPVSVAESATTSSAASAAVTTAAKEASVAPAVAAEKVAEASAAAPAVIPVPVVATTTTAADDPRRERVSRASDEAKKLFSGESYDESVIGSEDREMRRLVGAELASALVGRNPERRERAREAFMKHGYFDDATRDLRTAESENERAAAARRLSFVQDREATPHLVGALGDSSPDVRRAAVEALMDLRDPAAIAPLNSLLHNETDRKVPRNLISQAIEASATAPGPTAPPVSEPTRSAVSAFAASAPQPAPPSFETEREVIEL